ncbi:MAG: permease-like cell division protein FtsX [Candidatus Azobacteroides sp.]|nr:permease-like cell division protein FtsX [Candidatus Azobacteroides sp.]
MKKKHKFSTTFFNSRVTTTVSITLVLFLLGMIIFLSFLGMNLSTYVKETLSFDVVLQDNISEYQIKNLQKQLDLTPFAKSTTYISKKEAAAKLVEEIGQNPEEFLGFNPLPAIIVVHLKSEYANLDSLSRVENQLQRFSNTIKATEYRKDLLQSVNENIARVGFFLFIVAVILLFISFALINNTIRLMVYSKRFNIRTMQLVGAKKGFIRKPFILSNMLSGMIAAVIACGFLYWLIYYVSGHVPNLRDMVDIKLLATVGGSMLILGVLISWIATHWAVNKYIHADTDDLYIM